MSKTKKIWIIVASCLLALGFIICVFISIVTNFDFGRFNSMSSEHNEYVFENDFDSVSVDVAVSKVTITKSDSKECRVECDEVSKMKHYVSVENGTLTIRFVDERKWYERIGVSFCKMQVIVYLPNDAYTDFTIKSNTGDVTVSDGFSCRNITIKGNTSGIACNASASETMDIDTDTGAVSVENVSAGAMNLKCSTGKIQVNSAKIDKKADFKTSTGKIILVNVVAEGELSAVSATGNIEFENCDAASIYMKSNTGNVKGSLLTPKVFITDTGTGSIKVPSSTEGGRCEITTSTGNINVTISDTTP